MIATFFNGLDELYHLAKIGIGCRCENMVFVTMFCCLLRSEAGALFVRGGHNSSKYCVTVYGSILMRFSPFVQNGSAFQSQYMILILVARWRHKFREKNGQQLRKFKKSAEKFVHTTSCRSLRDLKKNSTAVA